MTMTISCVAREDNDTLGKQFEGSGPDDNSYTNIAPWDSAFCFQYDPLSYDKINGGTVSLGMRYLSLDKSWLGSIIAPPTSGAPRDIFDKDRCSDFQKLDRHDPLLIEITRLENTPIEQPFPLIASRFPIPGIRYHSDPRHRTKNLFLNVQEDTHKIVLLMKKHFDRPRPYQRTGLRGTISPHFYIGHPSYPSGHSTHGYTIYEVCKQLMRGTPYEDLLPAIRNKALGYALNREIAGVHFLSDSDAGKALAEAIIKTLLNNNQKFKDDLDAAKAEWVK
jgi:membrane-associated phospholipid phosphatase